MIWVLVYTVVTAYVFVGVIVFVVASLDWGVLGFLGALLLYSLNLLALRYINKRDALSS